MSAGVRVFSTIQLREVSLLSDQALQVLATPSGEIVDHEGALQHRCTEHVFADIWWRLTGIQILLLVFIDVPPKVFATRQLLSDNHKNS